MTSVHIRGFTVYRALPHDQPPTKSVMYLHGGKYVRKITLYHWRFISKLVDLGIRVDIPLYGLAPRNSHRDAIAFLTAVLEQLTLESSSATTTLIGDSAGGALAVIVSQHRAAASQPLPDRLILISPWLDVTMTNPKIAAVERYDPWLKSATLIRNGLSWANGEDPRNPDISPIYGKLSDLPPIDLYVGTHDVLYPDAVRFAQMARQAGSQVDLHVEQRAFHNFVLAPIPEGKRALGEILDQLNRP